MVKYILSILFFCTAFCLADPKIDKLVEQLGADSFKDRKKAEISLWELLPESEGALRKAAESSDPEVNIRAKRVLDKYEKGILPGVTDEIKLKIEQFWETAQARKPLYLRDWLYGSEFKDIKFIIHLIKLAEKKGESVLISKMSSQSDLLNRIYLSSPNSNEYRFFIRKYAEQGNEEIYLNWVRAGKSVKSEISHFESHPRASEESIKSILYSLYQIAGNKVKAAELSRGDVQHELVELLKKKEFSKILAEEKYIQSTKAIAEERSKLLYLRLSGDKEKYRLAKQTFIDEYAMDVNKKLHMHAVHALISNGEFEDARQITQKIDPLWYSRILTLSTDLERKIEFVNKQKDSGAAAYMAFEYYRLFKKDECKKWLEKAKLSELSDRWLYYYVKAYTYAYGLEEAFDHVADDFAIIASNSRQQVYYALCPEFRSLAGYVVGYRKAELRDNFLILKKFVTKKIKGEELSDFYFKVGTNNGRISEYKMKLVFEAASYLKDEKKLKSLKEEFLKFDSNRLYLAKKHVLLQNFKEAAKLLDGLNVKDYEFLFFLYLKAKTYQGLGDLKKYEKYINLLKTAPVNYISLSEELLEYMQDMGDKEVASFLMDLYQYSPVLGTGLLEKLIEHNIEKEDFDQAEFYSVQYYLNRNRSTVYLFPSQSLRVYLNFVNIDFLRKLKAGKVKDAVQAAESILKVTPHIYDFHVGVVNSLKAAGFTKESDSYFEKYMNHYEKMIEFSDVNSTALNDWAWSAALCNRELVLAEKRSRMAVKLAPENANLLDTLAEILYRQGKTEEAVKIQTKACELTTESKFSSFRAKLNRFKSTLKQ